MAASQNQHFNDFDKRFKILNVKSYGYELYMNEMTGYWEGWGRAPLT